MHAGRKRIGIEILGLERLEIENKIIIDVNPLTPFSDQKVRPRFNNTINTPRSNAASMFTFQARILPQTSPYCLASFLIEIGFPEVYPFNAPKIVFLDPIYHPSVFESDTYQYSRNLARDKPYDPRTPLVDMIETIIHTIDSACDPVEIVDDQCYEEYQIDFQTFYQKALEFTLSYGRPRY